MPEEEAREIAYQKVLWRLKQIFFDQYVDFLYYSQQLHDYDRHINLLTDLDSKLDENEFTRTSIRRVLARHFHKFEDVFLYTEQEMEQDQEDAEENWLADMFFVIIKHNT